MWLSRRMASLPMPAAPLPPGFTLQERVVDGASGVKVRIVSPPSNGAPRPAVLWIHGGGYVMGTARQDDRICVRFAERLGAVVISVDYRLAPDHPFPAPLDDCFAAFEFVHREADALGIDPAKVVLGGQSAGGGLAAALALLVHDRGRPKPLLQVLVYPMLDDRTCARTVDDGLHRVWDAPSNRLGWAAYLGQEPGGADVTDHAAPARRVDLSGLPPAWIGVGTLDLFHDEDVAYATRLRQAEVPVTLDIVDGAFHGFDAVLGNAPVSRRFVEAQITAIQHALG